jgi:hypothetical protein
LKIKEDGSASGDISEVEYQVEKQTVKNEFPVLARLEQSI